VKRSQNDVKEVPLRAVLKAIVWVGLGLDKLVGSLGYRQIELLRG
jgi:hypothetical protein